MNNLKEIVLINKNSKKILLRCISHLILDSYLTIKFFYNSRYRSEELTKWFFKKDIHQKSTFTKQNRYPLLFELCHKIILDNENTKILSFGCSTGEEVETLKKYFPKSKIFGTDINRYCIQQCKKKNPTCKTNFFHAKSKPFDNLVNLDAVFCLAVFQNSENRNNKAITKSNYPFSKFEQEIIHLDKKLNVGGVLIIDHSDFDFLEISMSKKYKPIDIKGNQIIRTRPTFNSENKKVSSQTNFYRIFQKIK